ncbi:hypothetical protein L1049_003373 [Liquidambar formosana]|uniref:Uncharacterized protein n=1 Tax=Liquidambar formosana TaxID=63359 RepID=A0AAP0NJP3_LIQFO
MPLKVCYTYDNSTCSFANNLELICSTFGWQSSCGYFRVRGCICMLQLSTCCLKGLDVTQKILDGVTTVEDPGQVAHLSRASFGVTGLNKLLCMVLTHGHNRSFMEFFLQLIL